MNKIVIFAICSLACAVIFSFCSISFSPDISLLSFPLGIAFSLLTSYFLVYKGFLKNDFKSFRIGRKLYQYISYVLLVAFIVRRSGINETPFYLDLVTVIFWLLLFFSSIVVLRFVNEKNLPKFFPDWKKEIELHRLDRSIWDAKRILAEIVDWADALVQAVFMVLLIQIFFLQLYIIPSESMVPSFLIGDRVVVFKTASGPVFPLSDVGIPSNKKYERGDVVVFRNPHYGMDRKSEVKSVVSQIVYMLTFTLVNMNVDDEGNPKADPLVKRVCGVPGEQLVMQDGVLYARTAEKPDFEPVVFDSKYGCWNLNEVPNVLKPSIQTIPLSQTAYEAMIDVEKARRDYDLESAKARFQSYVRRFDSLYLSRKGNLNLIPKENRAFKQDFTVDQFEMDPFNYALNLYACDNGNQWFNAFMNSWMKVDYKIFESDPYSFANFKLNVMIKEKMALQILDCLETYAQGGSEVHSNNDGVSLAYLSFYTQILDQRNMPVFPANDEEGNPVYISDDEYFMMGDNRFNSLDMRHSYEQKTVALDKNDPYSVLYDSNMEPQCVSRKRILGTAVYRFWPWSRRGPVQVK